MPTAKGITDEMIATWVAKGLIKPMAPAVVQPVDDDASEREFQRELIRFAKRNGWDDVYHTFNSKRSSPGFPDCVFGRESRAPHIIVVELKSEVGELTEDQKRWLNFFRLAGVPTFVWRPCDWSEIQRVLSSEKTGT